MSKAADYMKLTKKRLKALDAALSTDDILYEKFRHLHEELDRKYRKLYEAERVVEVLQKRDKYLFVMKIVDIQVTPRGTSVIVE